MNFLMLRSTIKEALMIFPKGVLADIFLTRFKKISYLIFYRLGSYHVAVVQTLPDKGKPSVKMGRKTTDPARGSVCFSPGWPGCRGMKTPTPGEQTFQR